MRSEQPTCFVIMPFSVRDHDLEKYNGDRNHWNEVYEGLIEPAVEAAGMRLERDDDDLSSRLVVDGIWKKIENADVVLCDLSSFNPNVYLELGWALRADKKFVLIKDELTDFSFDLNQFHTCVYSSKLKPSSLKVDVKKLSKAIEETASEEDRQYSMVKRMALTTAIELDAGSDRQADMLELIYKKLDALPQQNKTYSKPITQERTTSNNYGLYIEVGDRVVIRSLGFFRDYFDMGVHPIGFNITTKNIMEDIDDWKPSIGDVCEITRILSPSQFNKDAPILILEKDERKFMLYSTDVVPYF
jgi:hypothetical protein